MTSGKTSLALCHLHTSSVRHGRFQIAASLFKIGSEKLVGMQFKHKNSFKNYRAWVQEPLGLLLRVHEGVCVCVCVCEREILRF